MEKEQKETAEEAGLHRRAQAELVPPYQAPDDQIHGEADGEDQDQLPKELDQQGALLGILDLPAEPAPEAVRIADAETQLLDSVPEAVEGTRHGLEDLGAERPRQQGAGGPLLRRRPLLLDRLQRAFTPTGQTTSASPAPAAGEAAWWTDGGPRVAARREAGTELPQGPRFAALIDDAWGETEPAPASTADQQAERP